MNHDHLAAAHAVSGAIAVSIARQVVALTPIPSICWLETLSARITAIAGGATIVSWGISRDALGDFLIVPVTPVLIALGATAEAGSVNAQPAYFYMTLPGAVAGTLYLVVSCDVGTLTLTPDLLCRT